MTARSKGRSPPVGRMARAQTLENLETWCRRGDATVPRQRQLSIIDRKQGMGNFFWGCHLHGVATNINEKATRVEGDVSTCCPVFSTEEFGILLWLSN